MKAEKIKAIKEKLIQSLEKNLGIVTPTCKEVGISRESFYRYYREDEEFRQRVDDINEITLDFAETQLLRKIKEGSERSILFYMKYRGRKRGYNDQLTIDGQLDINKITFEVINKKSADDDVGTED